MIMSGIGKFTPLLSEQQLEILKSFLPAIQSPAPISDEIILDFMHQLLVNLFSNSYLLKDCFASVIEQTVLVTCISPGLTSTSDIEWRSASWMYSVVSIYLRISKWTLVQAAALGGEGSRYVRSSSTGPESSDGHDVDALMNETDIVPLLDKDADVDDDEPHYDESVNRKEWVGQPVTTIIG